MIYGWLIGIIVLVISFLYIIGRNVDPKDGDIGHLIFMCVIVSIAWPLILGIALVAAPFYLPYYFGKRNRQKALAKAEMWDKLKK